jgi:hypothetical protein
MSICGRNVEQCEQMSKWDIYRVFYVEMFVLFDTINLEENPSVNGKFTSQGMYAVFPPIASDKHTVIFLTG